MARILLFMCSFLIPYVLSTSTTIVSPSLSVSTTANSYRPTISIVKPAATATATATATTTTTTTTTATATTTTATATATATATTVAVVSSTIDTAPTLRVNVTSSTSVAPAQTSSVNVTLSTSVSPVPPATKIYKARMTVNETYYPGYSNSSSEEFDTFATKFNDKVRKFLKTKLLGFVRVEVTNLENGSVVVDFDIVVETSSNATVDSIARVLKAGSGGDLGYTILGKVIVNATDRPSTSSSPSPTTTAKETKATEIWDKAIDLATPLGTFIIVVVAVALLLILLIALICVCCKYAKLKKKTGLHEHYAINDSEWIRSSDDLLMWERNLRASEVKTTNGVSSRPVNEKRT